MSDTPAPPRTPGTPPDGHPTGNPSKVTQTYSNGTKQCWTEITLWTVTDTGYSFFGKNEAGNVVEVILEPPLGTIEIEW